MYEYETIIKIHEADAAGILFFANYFKLAHDAYESFMASIGMDLGEMIRAETTIIPLVHAEMNYKTSLVAGDRAVVKMRVKRIGETSFTLHHEIYKNGKVLAAHGETVHVYVDAKTNEKSPLPESLLNHLR